tara:strand:+ start:242 stop:505 length:264 start_codon:yes stop_codon:yes gene_type:complete
MKQMTQVEKLILENAQLKQLLKELMERGGLKGLKDEMAKIKNLFGTDKHASEYHSELCDLSDEIYQKLGINNPLHVKLKQTDEEIPF